MCGNGKCPPGIRENCAKMIPEQDMGCDPEGNPRLGTGLDVQTLEFNLRMGIPNLSVSELNRQAKMRKF